MIRTRVGYSGGKSSNPTYRSIGDHSEAIQIDFDPNVISYEELLDIAQAQGNFVGMSISNQYRSAVFYHDKSQLQAARKKGVKPLEPFGTFTRAEVSAMGAVIEYLTITQRGNLPLLRPPQKEAEARTVQIDAATRRNLELTHSLNGGRAGSLLSIMDNTATAGGARLLERRIASPSRVVDVVTARADAVSFAYDNARMAQDIRQRLRNVPDLDRALSRLSLDRGGPRDLAAIRNGLIEAEALHQSLTQHDLPDLLHESRT